MLKVAHESWFLDPGCGYRNFENNDGILPSCVCHVLSHISKQVDTVQRIGGSSGAGGVPFIIYIYIYILPNMFTCYIYICVCFFLHIAGSHFVLEASCEGGGGGGKVG